MIPDFERGKAEHGVPSGEGSAFASTVSERPPLTSPNQIDSSLLTRSELILLEAARSDRLPIAEWPDFRDVIEERKRETMSTQNNGHGRSGRRLMQNAQTGDVVEVVPLSSVTPQGSEQNDRLNRRQFVVEIAAGAALSAALGLGAWKRDVILGRTSAQERDFSSSLQSDSSVSGDGEHAAVQSLEDFQDMEVVEQVFSVRVKTSDVKTLLGEYPSLILEREYQNAEVAQTSRVAVSHETNFEDRESLEESIVTTGDIPDVRIVEDPEDKTLYYEFDVIPTGNETLLKIVARDEDGKRLDDEERIVHVESVFEYPSFEDEQVNDKPLVPVKVKSVGKLAHDRSLRQVAELINNYTANGANIGIVVLDKDPSIESFSVAGEGEEISGIVAPIDLLENKGLREYDIQDLVRLAFRGARELYIEAQRKSIDQVSAFRQLFNELSVKSSQPYRETVDPLNIMKTAEARNSVYAFPAFQIFDLFDPYRREERYPKEASFGDPDDYFEAVSATLLMNYVAFREYFVTLGEEDQADIGRVCSAYANTVLGTNNYLIERLQLLIADFYDLNRLTPLQISKS